MNRGNIFPAEAAGRGWKWFPRFIFYDQDNWKKLFEYFEIYERGCMKQKKLMQQSAFSHFSFEV